MSKLFKIIFWIVVILIAIYAIWWLYSPAKPPQTSTPNSNNPQTSQAPANATVESVSLKNTSDAALFSDLSNIDLQLKSLDADSASIDTSIESPTISMATSIITIIAKANKEIDLRVKELNNELTLVNSLKKMSAAGKTNLALSLQTEIDELTALKTKIGAETNLAETKIDYQSITKSYRIYALVIPQTKIIIASEKVLTISDSMNTLYNKVQARVTKLTGVNSETIKTKLSDYGAKIVSAKAKANSANNIVFKLFPDQGDDTKMAENKTALKEAGAQIKSAQTDLGNARKDISEIISYLKTLPAK
ncbi:MAG: hypothetical protein NTV36_02740 [Candidatus Staskawiczbacteria bacterium]|nr:hypothetical protein [Candidatus Staskawiczbacteria bacterium]